MLRYLKQTLQTQMQWIVTATPSSRYAAALRHISRPLLGTGAKESMEALFQIFFLTDMIEVVNLDGNHVMIQNPLYSYHFHPIMDGHFEGRVRGISCTPIKKSSLTWKMQWASLIFHASMANYSER